MDIYGKKILIHTLDFAGCGGPPSRLGLIRESRVWIVLANSIIEAYEKLA